MDFVRTVDLHRHVEASHSVVSDASSSNENDDDTVKDLRKETDHKSDDDDYKPEAEPEPEPEKRKVLKKRKAQSLKQVRLKGSNDNVKCLLGVQH